MKAINIQKDFFETESVILLFKAIIFIKSPKLDKRLGILFYFPLRKGMEGEGGAGERGRERVGDGTPS